MRRAQLAQVERVEWDVFRSERFAWAQGEHVSLIGPTGAGKTTLALSILPLRRYVTVVATKPADPVLHRLRRHGFTQVPAWPPPPEVARVLLWPRFRGKRDLAAQRAAISDGLVEMFSTGGWTVYVDELSYLCSMLKLDTDLRLLWLQGRALKLTIVGGTQRPAWVPLEMYSQAAHLFFWRSGDKRDLDRIAGIGQADPMAVRHYVANLDWHDVLHVNTQTGAMTVTRVSQ